MITVITPAATTALTTSAALALALPAETAAMSTEAIAATIADASALVQSYLGYTLGYEVVSEVLHPRRLDTRVAPLVLNRFPVQVVTSVTVDGTVLDPAAYELDAMAGMLYRLANADWTSWTGKRVTVVYGAGWALPGDANRTLPRDIEAATISLIQSGIAERSRDPALRSQTVLNGLVSESFFAAGSGSVHGLPADVAARLLPYRVATQ